MKLLGISGYSGSGKTTLLTQLIPLLKQEGLSVALIKHSHHNMDIDVPGKDSYELRKAGADQVIVACDKRWAMIAETESKPVSLAELAEKFSDVDLVLVEGFKDEPIDKIICHRAATGKNPYVDDKTLAFATDIFLNIPLPLFEINDYQAIKNFILEWYHVK
ncbi:molybdopterin-guanine dinucleotide biosynthesis protein B [Zophobihabitans entericus]|uniref:Molybdopterin-guanine dinucleotide biosynthesis protein B n=1 Tax=Zophobihabitans entericus TaxID=1635327 RepID=A0A6G9IA81_9GAMM|nr:molybdopterin-guanine dinucleotide biosynthesis protein B [Zophobihabitans entericus]QIQ20490.1 molybdopterin-guanine dinucleotide biosynthesis protein B [Zophobihabitans entericus]